MLLCVQLYQTSSPLGVESGTDTWAMPAKVADITRVY